MVLFIILPTGPVNCNPGFLEREALHLMKSAGLKRARIHRAPDGTEDLSELARLRYMGCIHTEMFLEVP